MCVGEEWRFCDNLLVMMIGTGVCVMCLCNCDTAFSLGVNKELLGDFAVIYR